MKTFFLICKLFRMFKFRVERNCIQFFEIAKPTMTCPRKNLRSRSCKSLQRSVFPLSSFLFPLYTAGEHVLRRLVLEIRATELERDDLFSTCRRGNELTRVRFNYAGESDTGLIDIQSTGKSRRIGEREREKEKERDER